MLCSQYCMYVHVAPCCARATCFGPAPHDCGLETSFVVSHAASQHCCVSSWLFIVDVDRGSSGLVVPIRNSAPGNSISRAGHCHTGQLAVQFHHRSDLSQYVVCHEGKTLVPAVHFACMRALARILACNTSQMTYVADAHAHAGLNKYALLPLHKHATI